MKVEFIKSSDNFEKCPKTEKPEFAFIGRSNVGKSSLINMLSENSKLAKTSSKPGKTQLINHFLADDKWFLVDLPGYGWAKTSKEKKEKWSKMVEDYFLNRPNLFYVLVLVDSRLEPQKIDLEFINWLGVNQIPFIVVFTKSDKQSMNQTNKNIALFKKEMLKSWEDLPAFFITSAEEKRGRDELLKFINGAIQEVK